MKCREQKREQGRNTHTRTRLEEEPVEVLILHSISRNAETELKDACVNENERERAGAKESAMQTQYRAEDTRKK